MICESTSYLWRPGWDRLSGSQVLMFSVIFVVGEI